MYVAILIFFLIALVFLVLFHWRKKRIIKRVRNMCATDKQELLNDLVRPLGYWYEPEQDVFSSTKDAWQKELGYGEIYNRAAPFGNMIFDSQPLYFDYDDRTWLIEFWKGQYGINIGSEVGIYCADHIISPELRDVTLFHAPEADEYLDISCRLRKNGVPLASLTENHWWLTIFSMGRFSQPKELSLDISLRFPNLEMRDAFLDSLSENGYDLSELYICVTTVSLNFYTSERPRPWFLLRFYRWYVQVKNRLFCWLYARVTSPFYTDRDKLLYLYYYVPFAFRHMLRLRRYSKKPKSRHH